jgi:hypothetical protein
MSDDHSPGDRRKPYSDRGGPQGRHAETHDVEREQATNPKGPEPVDESFDEQLEKETPESIRQAHTEDTTSAANDNIAVNQLPDLTNDELATLAILDPSTPLEQGAVYLDINDKRRKPFTATGAKTAGEVGRVVAKKTTDYELWNRLTGTEHDRD